ncbi:MAG: DUF4923 family protein [Bacteroidaceae bacterium]|nr:DUF4923 family protein [Bacteroidaceae bacterium]
MKKILTFAVVAMFVATSELSAQTGFSNMFSKLFSGNSTKTEQTTTATEEKTTATETPDLQSGITNLIGKVTGASNGTSSTITNVLTSLLGNSMTLSDKLLKGEWTYAGTSCVLESDQALSNIGGTVVTSKIEEKLDTYLSRVGVKEGTCTFTFMDNDSCKFSVAGREIHGQYVLDAQEKKINFTFYGRLSMTAYVTYELTSLNIVFNADKMLALLQKVLNVVSSNSGQLASLGTGNAATTTAALGTISSLLNNYNGMMLGMKLKK